jgi:hypothetical protein
MKKCEPGCTCKRHQNGGHRVPCKPGCTCGKHALRNSGQFKPGSAGFTGPHSDETKAKLASYTGEQVSSYKHGWAGTPTYVSWHAMISRCADPRNASYPSYGGRGITVCERWLKFENFLSDVGARPSLDHSIDRENRDCNYEPGKVRWATREEQNANRPDPGGWVKRRQRQ